MVVGSIVVEIAANTAKLQNGIGQAIGSLQSAGQKMQSIGAGLTAGVTLPLAAIGVAAVAASETIDDAMDRIATGTGAVGPALAGLERDFQAVFSTVPASAAESATAIADLHSRTGQTGESLQQLAGQILEVARLTGSDLAGTIASSTRLFGDWGVAVADQSAALDLIFRASQQTGIGFSRLNELMVEFGAPLREVGLSLTEGAALLAKWEEEGVNVETVLSGLRIGLAHFAEAGVAAPQALDEIIARITELGPSAEATAIAMETFGSRAGVDMARAILEGRFAIDELVGSLQDSESTILGTAESTAGLAERMAELKNQATLALAPIGESLVEAFLALAPAITNVLDFIARLAQGFGNLSPTSQTAILALAGILGAIGPVLGVVGTLIGLASSLGIGFAALAGPIAIAVAAIVGIVAVGVLLVENWDEIKEGVARLGERVSETFRRLKEDVTGFVTRMVDAIREALVARFQAVVDSVKQKVEAITGFFKSMYDKVAGNSYVPDMLAVIRQELDGGLGVVADRVGSHTGDMEGSFANLATQASTKAGELLANVKDRLVTDFSSQILGPLKGHVDSIVADFKGLKDRIAPFLEGEGGLLGFLKRVLVDGLDDIIQQFLTKAKEITEFFKKLAAFQQGPTFGGPQFGGGGIPTPGIIAGPTIDFRPLQDIGERQITLLTDIRDGIRVGIIDASPQARFEATSGRPAAGGVIVREMKIAITPRPGQNGAELFREIIEEAKRLARTAGTGPRATVDNLAMLVA